MHTKMQTQTQVARCDSAFKNLTLGLSDRLAERVEGGGSCVHDNHDDNEDKNNNMTQATLLAKARPKNGIFHVKALPRKSSQKASVRFVILCEGGFLLQSRWVFTAIQVGSGRNNLKSPHIWKTCGNHMQITKMLFCT